MRTRSFSTFILLLPTLLMLGCTQAELYKFKKAMRGYGPDSAQQRAVWHSTLEGRQLTVPLDREEPEFGFDELKQSKVTWTALRPGANGKPIQGTFEQWVSALNPRAEIKRAKDPKTGRAVVTSAFATFSLPETPQGQITLILGNQIQIIVPNQLADH